MVVVAKRDGTVPVIVVELELFRGESLGFGVVGHGDESGGRRKSAASPGTRARGRMGDGGRDNLDDGMDVPKYLSLRRGHEPAYDGGGGGRRATPG
jgi:hypothetical protein